MIARKIERLDEQDRRLLVAASVQGHEFDSATISEALEMDAAEVEERLEALERVHVFVKLVGEQEFADRTLTLRYRFVHILYQNTLYATLQPTRRAALSGRVAQAIVRHQGSELAGRRGAARHPVRGCARFRGGGEPVLRRGTPRGRPVRLPRGGHAVPPGAEGARDGARGSGPDAGRARAADDARAVAALDPGLGGSGSREAVSPRPADLPAAGQRAGALPGAVGADALPRDPRRPARLRDAGRSSSWRRPTRPAIRPIWSRRTR